MHKGVEHAWEECWKQPNKYMQHVCVCVCVCVCSGVCVCVCVAVCVCVCVCVFYLKLKVENHETENKMHLDTKYDCDKMAAASISTSSYYRRRTGSAGYHNYATLLIFVKWCRVNCSNWFKLFVNGKFTEGFHFPVLLYFPVFETQVYQVLFVSCDTTKCALGVPYLWKFSLLSQNFSPL